MWEAAEKVVRFTLLTEVPDFLQTRVLILRRCMHHLIVRAGTSFCLFGAVICSPFLATGVFLNDMLSFEKLPSSGKKKKSVSWLLMTKKNLFQEWLMKSPIYTLRRGQLEKVADQNQGPALSLNSVSPLWDSGPPSTVMPL